jgi:hypothetical protein
MTNNGFNQTLWAVSDPNWGNPNIIPHTVRSGQLDSEQAFLDDSSYGMYHGGTQFPLPEGKRGNMQAARKQGFKLVQLSFTTANIEIVG